MSEQNQEIVGSHEIREDGSVAFTSDQPSNEDRDAAFEEAGKTAAERDAEAEAAREQAGEEARAQAQALQAGELQKQQDQEQEPTSGEAAPNTRETADAPYVREKGTI